MRVRLKGIKWLNSILLIGLPDNKSSCNKLCTAFSVNLWLTILSLHDDRCFTAANQVRNQNNYIHDVLEQLIETHKKLTP